MEEDIELISILNSCKEPKLLHEIIENLKNEGVLTKNELQLCNECMRELETFGTTNLKTKVSDDSMLNEYEYSEIDDKVDEFIENRIYRDYNNIFSVPTLSQIFSKENVDLFLKGYVNRMSSKIDNSIFEDEDIFYNETKEIDISTACEKIDEFSLGLKRGTITTIIGDTGYFKSLWAINIAYQAASQGKNVMYLTIGFDKDVVAKRLLTRHSNNEKFERPLSYEDMHNLGNYNLFQRIFLDFQENYSYRLIIFDENDLTIPSIRSLRRLVAEAQRHFIDKNDSGIDLIVIDDLSYLSLFNGKTSTNSRDVVIREYYIFLKKLSKNILGTGDSCCILCTHRDIDDGVTAAKNEGNYKLGFIPKQIEFWSDDILTIYGSTIRTRVKSKLKVIKSKYGELMDKPISANINYANWFLPYDNMTNAEKKVLLELKDEQIKQLKLNVERLTSEIDYKEEYIDELKKKGINACSEDTNYLDDNHFIFDDEWLANLNTESNDDSDKPTGGSISMCN